MNAHINDSFALSKTELPNFDNNNIPTVKVKSIQINNYKIFHNYEINFVHNNEINNFACFIGSNGSGKSTTLEIIQYLFSNYDGYEGDRLKVMLGKCVRHVEGKDKSGIYGDADFSIKADIASSIGDYQVELTKNGFIKDHPLPIKELILRICYYTRFDQELRHFQLKSSKWEIFKELFEAVTGFEIEKEETLFTIENSVRSKKYSNSLNIAEEYVLGFYVKKPNETIYYRECSDGERKIIKSFSSLLNLEFSPSIILIDNVEMHVESGRHLPLIQAMKKCFSESQIVTTTHSYHISRNFSHKYQVYDLRLLNSNDIYRKQPWRLQLQDEIKDAIVKEKSIATIESSKGTELLDMLSKEIYDLSDFSKKVQDFINETNNKFINDLILK